MTAVRTDFPFAFDVIDPQWITLRDGTRIATTIWMPRTDKKVPCVVEMIPYRRRDGTVFRDFELHPWWAGHGIACCRVDLRGAGDSDGLLADEYLPREQEDACEIIAWLAQQPWSNGNVGMTGISWGGFNSLQVAAQRPPALKAIITLCSTDDRYADDVHYFGGALISENELWANVMLAFNSMPPDPQIVGERWREMWMRRLEANRSWSEHWLSHQRRDAYWKQGSVCEDWSRIQCAVMTVCGWEDSYSNTTPRLLEHLTCPKQAIMGPWSHAFPHRGDPGPNIGYLQEATRWWKHWLGGEDTGIMNEPQYRVFITGEEHPRPWYKTHAGSWAAEESWPSKRIKWKTLHLNEGKLAARAKAGPPMSLCSPATAGTDYGRHGGYGGEAPDLAIDQRREDGQSLCFDTEVLKDDLTLLGAVDVDLELSVDQPLAHVAVRLCDVYPDGTSAVMTYGVLNLTHRNSHEFPEPCPVNTPFKARVKLNDFGRTIPKGHRLRLAIQTQFWFVVWPQPKLATITLTPGTSKVRLPVRPASERDKTVRFEPAMVPPPCPSTQLSEETWSKTVEDDLVTRMRSIRLKTEFGRWTIDDRGIEGSASNEESFFIHPDDPLTARLVTTYRWSMKSGPADVSGLAHTELSADETHFHLEWRVEAFERGEPVFQSGASKKIKRDCC